MATFLDGVRALHAGKLRTFYYITGSCTPLADALITAIKAKAAVPAENRLYFNASTDDMVEVWDAVTVYGGSERRLVFIREAEAISSWSRFEELSAAVRARSAPPVTVVFLGTAPHFGEVTRTCHRGHTGKVATKVAGRSGKSLTYCPGCEELKKRFTNSAAGAYIEVGPPTEVAAVKVLSGSMEDSWRGFSPMPKPTALALLRYTGWDVTACVDVCRKARLLGHPVTEDLFAPLAAATSSATYADSLIALKKPDAAHLARELSLGEARSVVGLLSWRLGVLGRLYRALSRTENTNGLARSLGVHYTVITRERPYAKYYDASRCHRDTLALARADSALASGEHIGVLELLAYQW